MEVYEVLESAGGCLRMPEGAGDSERYRRVQEGTEEYRRAGRCCLEGAGDAVMVLEDDGGFRREQEGAGEQKGAGGCRRC